MAQIRWEEGSLQGPEVNLGWYSAGSGPIVLFLHGGPGHDHRVLRPLAQPLTDRFRCVLYDQRGSGRSHLDTLDSTTLHIDRFIEDIERLRIHLGQERLTLVGWSWGASLAAFYSALHPDRIERLAMIAPGPIPYEMVGVYIANQLRPLRADERARRAKLLARCEEALQAGDQARYGELYRQLMSIIFRVQFYDPAKARAYLSEYLEQVGDPYKIAWIERSVIGTLGEFGGWDKIGAWQAPTLIVYGYQDFEPITQAFTLKEWIPQARLSFLNECGHWPWLEQRESFYGELQAFLG